jgi:hypothetical protein
MSNRGAVLLTGPSSGIGRDRPRHLNATGLKRRRRAPASMLVAVAALALMANDASAHTSAVCALIGHHTTCIGTVANRTVTLGPAVATMTVRKGNGNLRLTVSPMVSLFTPPMAINANLICVDQNGETMCLGMTHVRRDHVLIMTTGIPKRTVVIRLSEAVTRPIGGDDGSLTRDPRLEN